MKRLMMAMAMVALVMGTTELTAQTANGNASITVPTVLVVSSVTDLTIDGTGFDFSAGETSTSTGTVDITTRSNVAHAVDVTGTAITDGTSNLGFSVLDAAGTYQAVGATAVKALANLAMGTQTNTVSFQATADVTTDAPGAYTGTITYTVVTNY